MVLIKNPRRAITSRRLSRLANVCMSSGTRNAPLVSFLSPTNDEYVSDIGPVGSMNNWAHGRVVDITMRSEPIVGLRRRRDYEIVRRTGVLSELKIGTCITACFVYCKVVGTKWTTHLREDVRPRQHPCNQAHAKDDNNIEPLAIVVHQRIWSSSCILLLANVSTFGITPPHMTKRTLAPEDTNNSQERTKLVMYLQ